MHSGVTNGWAILRTSGGRTLPVAASLSAGGFEAWTPAATISVRRPRSKLQVERTVPILPTFVFVRASHLPDMYRIIAKPVSPHPQFSVFQYFGRIPLLDDRDIGNLRAEEERARKAFLQRQRYTFQIGDRVHVTEGIAQGMSGVVERSNGKHAVVHFGGGRGMTIAAFLLRLDVVEAGHPERVPAA